jgi:hypothetical protein
MIGGGSYERGFSAGLDGKLKAPTTVALVVAGRVGVKRPSHRFACWRFSETLGESNCAAPAHDFDGALVKNFVDPLITSGPGPRHQLKARAIRAPGFAGLPALT